jgi:hypothetical protein
MNRPSADGRRRSGEMGGSANRSGGLHAKAGQLLSQEWESRQAGLEQERVNSGFFVSLELPACRHLQTGLVCWVRGSVFAGRCRHSRCRAGPGQSHGRAGGNDTGHRVSFRRSDPEVVLAFTAICLATSALRKGL